MRSPIEGVWVVESDPFVDERGQFSRVFCQEALADVLDHRQIVQINHSLTHAKGAVRGLHYQLPPHAEMKFVRCLKGEVFDVALDLRKNSSTFLKWFGIQLSESKCNMMVIPEGCAHGFQVLEEESQLIYLHTAMYNPQGEAGIHFDDPSIAIEWPLPPQDLSMRDNGFAFIDSRFDGVDI